MKTYWANLPSEILSRILDLTDRVAQLKECQVVCKGWSGQAQERIYKEALFETQAAVQVFFTTISSVGSPGVLVKKIYISKEVFTEDCVSLIAEHCPNIENLHLPAYDDNITSKLIREREENGRLQVVSNFYLYDKSSTNDYLNKIKLAYAFRNTINWLCLCDGSTTEFPVAKAEYVELYDNVMDKIQDFKNVKVLKMEFAVTKQEEEQILENKLESILIAAGLRTLTTIIYIPHRTTTINLGPTIATATNDDQRKVEDIIITDREQNLSNVQQEPGVKGFYADNISLNDKSVRYLMHKFPQLKMLSLNNSDIARSDNNNDDDNEEDKEATQRLEEYACSLNPMLMVNFFKYLVRMNFFDIHFLYPDEDKKLLNVVNRFVNFTTATTDKKLALSINYSTRQTIQSYPNMRIYQGCFNEDKKNALYILDLHYDKRSLDPHTAVLPHTDILDAIGRKIKYVFFDADGRKTAGRQQEEDVDIHFVPGQNTNVSPEELTFQKLAHGKCFEHLIEKSPSATHLTINHLDFWMNLNDVNAETNESITCLKVYDAFIIPLGFERIAKADLPNLRSLTISGCEGITANMNFPNHILDNFTYGTAGTFAMSAFMDDGDIFLHFKDDIEDKYLVMNRNTGEFTASSRLEYGEWDNSWIMGMSLHIGITCSFLKTFTFVSPSLKVTYQVHDD